MTQVQNDYAQQFNYTSKSQIHAETVAETQNLCFAVAIFVSEYIMRQRAII